MAYIKQVSDGDATGLLEKIFAHARERAGRVFGILRVQSQNPEVLRASLSMYQAIMFGPSPLSRSRREMLATVTSRADDCHY